MVVYYHGECVTECMWVVYYHGECETECMWYFTTMVSVTLSACGTLQPW